MTAHTDTTPLEVVRELHVLYGIAVTKMVTVESDTTELYAYRRLARELHRTIDNIAARSHHPADAIEELAVELIEGRHYEGELRALYETWAKNIRSIG